MYICAPCLSHKPADVRLGVTYADIATHWKPRKGGQQWPAHALVRESKHVIRQSMYRAIMPRMADLLSNTQTVSEYVKDFLPSSEVMEYLTVHVYVVVTVLK